MNEFLTFFQTQQFLVDRLGATPEEIAHEIAAWIGLRNLTAYQNIHVAGDRDLFYFSDSERATKDFDYLRKLLGCYFKRQDVERFQPADRYITGAALIRRWAIHCDGEAGAKQKIRSWCCRYEDPQHGEPHRLVDYFPGHGGTQASAQESENSNWPPLEMTLFSLKQIQAIELGDAVFQRNATDEKDVTKRADVPRDRVPIIPATLKSVNINLTEKITLTKAVLFIVNNVYAGDKKRGATKRVREVISRANQKGQYQGKLKDSWGGKKLLIGDPEIFWPWAVTQWRELQEVIDKKPPTLSAKTTGWDSSHEGLPSPQTTLLPGGYDELKQALADKTRRLVQAEYDLGECRARLAAAEAELEELKRRKVEINKNRGRRT